MKIPDYIEKLGADLQFDEKVCRIVYKDHNAVFSHIDPRELRAKFNEAMHGTVAHYAMNVTESHVTMTSAQIEEVAFGVVIHTLYIYNLWRHTYEDRKDQPLRVEASDLAHPQAHDCCWFYCETEFGAEYTDYAAALTGMSDEQFRQYMEGRQAFFDR